MKFILVLSLIALTSFSLAVEDEDVARRERIIANTLAQQEEIWKRFGVDPRMDQEATMSVVIFTFHSKDKTQQIKFP